MAIFKKKAKKVNKEQEEQVTTSVQDVSNTEKYKLEVVEPAPIPEHDKYDIKDIPVPPPPAPEPGKEPQEPPKPEQSYTMSLTENQVMRRISQLKQSENMQLFLKMIEGQEEYDEYLELTEALSDDQQPKA